MKTYKCGFKHCKHESQYIDEIDAVKVGARYLHKDCAKISEDINNTKDLYYEKISKTVVMKQLVSVINNIVFSKGIDSGFLYFSLCYATSNNIPIRSPYGLHYLIDNQKIKSAWSKKQSDRLREEIKEEFVEPKEKEDVKFKFHVEKTNGFGGILKGGN